MAHSKQPIDDHRDLYLEILKKAEIEADRALIQIISKKLKATLPHPKSTQDGCQVFSFPLISAPTINGEAGDDLFWKNRQFWQELVQFIVILGTGVSWFIFFCHLVAYRAVG